MKRPFFTTFVAAVALSVATAASAQQAPKKLNVGILELASNAAIFIAEAKGYFKAEGLTVNYKYFQAAAAVPTAVVSGDVDLGSTGITAALFNLGSKGGFKLLAGVMNDAPNVKSNVFVVSKKAYDAGFKTPQDMRGKKIGITTAGSTQHFYVGMLAKKYGIPANEVQMVPLQSLENLYAAVTSGNVDAIFPSLLAAEKLEQQGVAKIIASTGDLIQWQVTAIFANPDKVKNDREAVAAFIRAEQKAAKEYNETFNKFDAGGKVIKGPRYDEYLDIIAKALKQDKGLVERSLPYIDADLRLDVKSLQEQLKFWQDEGVVAKTVELAPILDTSFVKTMP